MSTKVESSARNWNVITQILLWPLVFLFMKKGHGAESDDIFCLQAIKNSLDTYDNLSSWDFKSNTTTTKDYICNSFAGVECFDMGLTGLRLSNMGLKGQFPSCMENLPWLQTLDFSQNELFGYIPSDLSSKLSYLTTLDLSNNKFYGEIPKDIAKCSLLNTLRLDGNKLTGQIPKELGLLPLIRDFSVANNMLSGPVPVFASNVDVSLSYANNSGLCGGILGSCEEDSLFDRSFWYSFVIGFVNSAIAFMYYCTPWSALKKKRSKAVHPLRDRKQKHQKDTTQVAELIPLAMQQQGNKELARLLERLIPRMNFMDLCKATDYFSADNLIGLGTTGIMYKAKLPNNCLLAVKRLYDSDRHKREFLLEAMVLGRHKHRNIATLFGFSMENNDKIFVYKFMSNGRLSDWLHPDEGHQSRSILLEWPERIHIALGLARGLSWLHEACKIVHLNLCAECILLDKNFEPKISNFGKVKFVDHKVEEHERMKLFSMDDLGEKGFVKRDVYDFGIILFELITGKRLSAVSDSSDSVDSSLLNFISNNLFTGPDDFYDAIDKSIIGEGFDHKIISLIEVACDCVRPCLEQRPSMVDMYKAIRIMWWG